MVEATPAKATKTAASKTPQKPGEEPKKRQRKDYKPLDFSAIQAEPVTSRETLVKHRNTKGERDPEQVAVDKLVKNAHQRWIEAGRPETWLESTTGYRLVMPTEQVETFVYRVRRAAVYYDVAVRFGKTIENGKMSELLFIAKDRPVKGEVDAEDDADAEDN